MAHASGLIPKARPRRAMLVEGPDDQGVLVAILRYLGAPERDPEVRKADGIDDLLHRKLPVQLKESDLGQLGIVVDADSNAEDRWKAVRGVLTAAGYKKIAGKPPLGGAIIMESGLPTVGIWIMPDNSASGAVEQFAKLLVPADDKLWAQAEIAVGQAVAIERRFGLTGEMKAVMHTWLAWQKEPGRPMGQAITKRFLEPSAAGANDLCDWLRRLFGL
jgi:uncharacterized protein DUF3226